MGFLALCFILLLIIVVVAVACLASDEPGGALATAIVGAIAFVGLFLFGSYHQIGSHEVGVVSGISGVVQSSVLPGTHTIAPWNSVDVVDTGVQSANFERLPAVSKESQDVWISVQVNYHLDPAKIIALYRTVGSGWFKTFVPGAVQQAVKEETTKFNTVQLAPHRVQMGNEIETSLKTALAPHSIYVDNVYLINVAYSQAFSNAIEHKQQASQEAARATLQAQKQENLAAGAKAAAIARAQGQAASIRDVADAEAYANRTVNKSLSDRVLRYTLIQKLAPNIKAIVPSGSNIYNFGALGK